MDQNIAHRSTRLHVYATDQNIVYRSTRLHVYAMDQNIAHRSTRLHVYAMDQNIVYRSTRLLHEIKQWIDWMYLFSSISSVSPKNIA